jgi:lipopolysaccharide transport system permease protein/teichoic acid transport system permease protein
MRKYIHELFKRKDLLIYLVISGLKAQHSNSFLGYFWWLLDPLLGILIYYFVVAVVFNRGGEGYGVYLVVGMVVWRWLSSAVITASRSITSQSGIITQVYLPKAIFPIGATLTQLFNFSFGLIVIAFFLIFFKVVPGVALLWLPFIIIIQLLFLIAITLLIAYICVFVRDIDTLLNHIMQLWFFGSPVIWREDMIPLRVHWILDFNPMAHFLTSYRNILLYQTKPEILTLSLMGIFSFIMIIYFICFYSKNEHKIIKSL